MGARLRSARTEDVSSLVGLWAHAGDNRARPVDRTEVVERLLVRDPEAIIVAERDGRIVGTIVAGWDGWRAHLYRLAVDPEVSGLGLGRRLVTAAEKRLSTLGAERIDAMVLDDNADGRALWSALGYTPQDDWTRWVKPVAR